MHIIFHTSLYVEHVTYQQKFSPVTPGFCMLAVAQRDFFLTEVLFFHEPPQSPIVGVSDIGQVSTAMSSTYFKLFLST
jgi:hypothetical protein